MSAGYANLDTRLSIERGEAGGSQLVCKACKRSLADHDRERVTPDDGKGPAGSYHYRYVCDDGYRPDLEREVEERPLLADGGLPEWAIESARLGSDSTMIRCQTCGSEAATLTEHEHRDGCPEADQTQVATDGGEVASLAAPELLQDALDTWGTDLQEVIAVEEAAELIVNLARIARYPDDLEHRPSDDEVLDELADLRVMVDQLALVYGREDFQSRVDDKLARLDWMIAEEQSTGGSA